MSSSDRTAPIGLPCRVASSYQPAPPPREAEGLAIPGDSGSSDEISMRGIGPGVAVGLEVAEQRPQRRELAADRAVAHASLGELLPGVGRDAGMGQELVEVLATRLPGMGRRSPEQPGHDGLGHLVAHVAGDRPSGKGRYRSSADRHKIPGSSLDLVAHGNPPFQFG